MAKEKRTETQTTRYKPSELDLIRKTIEESGDTDLTISVFVRRTVLRACKSTREKLLAWWNDESA